MIYSAMVVYQKEKASPGKFLVNQKIGIFIDAENIEMSGYSIYNGRTNYKKLIEAIGGIRQITRIIYYKPEHKEITEDFKKFWYEQGGEINQPQKNVDAWLIIDAITMAEKLDVIVIVGGDKDYLPLIWYLKSRGCKAEVWSYPETCSQIMIDAADYFYGIDEKFTIRDTKSKPIRSSSSGSSETSLKKSSSKSRRYTGSKKLS